SESYKKLLIEPFKDKIQTGNKVVKVIRENNKVLLKLQDGSSRSYDKVILACHADQALELLDKPETIEEKLLGPFKYEKNIAVVHTDERVMPKNKKTWSSWNYRIEEIEGKRIPTTIYWMNSLQGVSKKKNYFVSINPILSKLDKTKIIKSLEYEHPLFDMKAINAQKDLSLLNKNGPVYFCGSYFKYGFHEDAFKSAKELCNSLT
ncbi:MAG: FAD-dependent oxidoreductase, partial [Bacteroidia bacterium]|nr:FAD-dependent oxidoreductase [Bacteroidia bacterium]